VGWAAGVERMVLSREPVQPEPAIEIFFAFEDSSRRTEALPLLARLRADGHSCETDYAGRSLKGQLTQAQRLGAATIVIAHERGFTVRRRGEEDIEVAKIEDLPL
jgi:histidyl-tRNA synthetase